jgi:hypothetical protein
LGQRRKKSRLEVIVGLLYGDGLRLVTTPMKEGLPAARRRGARRRAVLHAYEEDEDDLLPLIFLAKG